MQHARTLSFINKQCGLVNAHHHHEYVRALLSQACTSPRFFRLHNVNHTQAFFSGALNLQAGRTRGPALSFINLVVGEPSPHHSLNQQSSTRAGFLSHSLWFLGRGHRDAGVISLTRIEVVVDESSLKPRHLSTSLQSSQLANHKPKVQSFDRTKERTPMVSALTTAKESTVCSPTPAGCSADTFFTHSFFCRPLTIRLLSGKWSARNSNKLASCSFLCPVSNLLTIRLLAHIGAYDSHQEHSYTYSTTSFFTRFSRLAHMLQLILRLRDPIPLRGNRISLKILAKKIDPPLRGVYLAKIRSGGILQ